MSVNVLSVFPSKSFMILILFSPFLKNFCCCCWRIIALKILFSVKPQHESTIGIHISLPFWTSLPSPAPPQPSRLIQVLILMLRSLNHLSGCLHVVWLACMLSCSVKSYSFVTLWAVAGQVEKGVSNTRFPFFKLNGSWFTVFPVYSRVIQL